MPFLPFDEAKAQDFSDRLGKTFFRSPEAFVQLYNEELINRKHKNTVSTLRELTEIYRDVRVKGTKIVFVSTDEVLMYEILNNLQNWDTILKIKRETEQLVADSVLTPSESVTFNSENVGYALKPNPDAEEGGWVRAGEEKLFRNQEDVVKASQELHVGSEIDGNVVFSVAELVQLDTNFVQKVHSDIPTR